MVWKHCFLTLSDTRSLDFAVNRSQWNYSKPAIRKLFKIVETYFNFRLVYYLWRDGELSCSITRTVTTRYVGYFMIDICWLISRKLNFFFLFSHYSHLLACVISYQFWWNEYFQYTDYGWSHPLIFGPKPHQPIHNLCQYMNDMLCGINCCFIWRSLICAIR